MLLNGAYEKRQKGAMMGLYQELGIQDMMSDAELATYLAAIRREWNGKRFGGNPMEKQQAEKKLRQIDVLSSAEARVGNFQRPALVMKTLCAAMDREYSDYRGLEEGIVRSCAQGVFRGEFRSVLVYLSKIGEKDLAEEWVRTLEEFHYPFDQPKRRTQEGAAVRQETQEKPLRKKSSRKTARRRSSGRKSSGKKGTAAGSRAGTVVEAAEEFFYRISRNAKRSFRSMKRGKAPVGFIAAAVTCVVGIILLIGTVNHISTTKKAEAEAKAAAEAAEVAEQEEQAKARKAQEELLAGLQGMENYTLSVNENAAVSYQRAEPASCTASSELVGASGTVYGTVNLSDENLETSWQEGEEGDGIGVTITSVFSSRTNIKAIAFYNGNQISQERLEANNRLADITITVSCEGETYSKQYTLQDTLGEQDLVFDSPVPTESLTIRVDSVYEGSIYQDTVLTGLYFYSGS
jgi:hypothetical protein